MRGVLVLLISNSTLLILSFFGFTGFAFGLFCVLYAPQHSNYQRLVFWNKWHAEVNSNCLTKSS